jgi:hypothetical protein
MPQPPGWLELQAAAILLGVDHEYPTGPDHQVNAPMAIKQQSLGGLLIVGDDEHVGA